jgi:gamma-glutamylcyclotransferase (GGCT)/AIG2-like uncharacterized protein YtfP
MRTKFYLAYGANTNHASMAARCPGARYVGNAVLRGHKLVFRSVADVIEQDGSDVVCAVWAITPACEASLDVFEGVRSGFYLKRYVRMNVPGHGKREALIYVMPRRADRHEPPFSYADCLAQGYADCGIPMAQLDEAIAEAQEHAKRRMVNRTKWHRIDAERAAADDADEVIRDLPEPMPLPNGRARRAPKVEAATASELSRKLRAMSKADRRAYIDALVNGRRN